MNNPFGHQLYNWHIEASSKCALKCLRCLRQTYPGTFKNKELKFNFIKKVFTPEFLRKNVLRITFSGGTGDAIYCSEFLKIVEYLKDTHPDFQLVLVTNGGHKSKKFWTTLASLLGPWDEVIFSLDGHNARMNAQYRINADWKGSMNAIDIMVKSKATIRWQCIIFKFNQFILDEIREFARSKGVDQFHLTKSYLFGSNNNRYFNEAETIDHLKPSHEFVSNFTRTERMKYLFKNNTEKDQARSKFYELFNPIAKSYEDKARNKYKNSYIMPTCKFGYRGSYIDYQGIYYPCSWVSHYFDHKTSKYNPLKKIPFNKFFFEKEREKFNLHKRSLEEILSDPLWKKVESDWLDKKTMALICEEKCQHNTTKSELLSTKEVVHGKK